MMMAAAAHRLGVNLAVLDPKGTDSPAGKVAARAVEGSFKDEAKIRELAEFCDVLTVEIEHVNCDILEQIQSEGKTVEPSPATIRLIQDKFVQKEHLKAFDIPLGEYASVVTQEDAKALGERFGYPMMLKTRKDAYDGKGNAVIEAEDKVAEAFEKLGGHELYIERWVPFQKELAVMVARSVTGEVLAYPTVETAQKDSICHTVVAPACIPASALAEASRVAAAAISTFEAAGIFGVELFLLDDGRVLLNEIAPRPHNSGHYTIEACETDQFEMHLRAVLGLPLCGASLRVGASVMLNVLGEGDDMAETKAVMKQCLSVPGAGLHWYGKEESRKGRKMGHITFVGDSMQDLLARLPEEVATIVGLDAPPVVGVIMGSDSDLPTMSAACKVLKEFGIKFECTVVSAHRTPARMYEYSQSAAGRGIKVIIAGAGGAAHLPGMVAALTPLPVIGVPVKTSILNGNDSLLSIVQMPRGIPVATVAIGNAMNAGLLAVRMLSIGNTALLTKMEVYMARQGEEVESKGAAMEANGWEAYLDGMADKKVAGV